MLSNHVKLLQILKDIARNTDGFINIASDAVKVSSKYQSIVENLLGNTIIVDDLKHANDLARAIAIELELLR